MRCLRRSETCEVSENYFSLFTIYLMLFCNRYLPHICIAELAAYQVMLSTCFMRIFFMFALISYTAYLSPPLLSLIMQRSSETFSSCGIVAARILHCRFAYESSSELNLKVVFFLTLPCNQCYSRASCSELKFL